MLDAVVLLLTDEVAVVLLVEVPVVDAAAAEVLLDAALDGVLIAFAVPPLLVVRRDFFAGALDSEEDLMGVAAEVDVLPDVEDAEEAAAAGAFAASKAACLAAPASVGLPEVGSFFSTGVTDLVPDGLGTLVPLAIASSPSRICVSCIEPAGELAVGVARPCAILLGRSVSKSQSLTEDDSLLCPSLKYQ